MTDNELTLTILQSAQWEGYTERIAIMVVDGKLQHNAAIIEALKIHYPADYAEMVRTATEAGLDPEKGILQYIETMLEKDQELRKKLESPVQKPRARREGLEALQYVTDNGIALIGVYDSKATINNTEIEGDYKTSFTTDIETIKNLMDGKGDKEGRAKGTKIKRFSFIPANHCFLCLDIDVKDGKNGITDLDRLLSSWGKTKEKRPAALKDIEGGSFPCYTQTPSGGLHLYFKYTGQAPESGLFSKDYGSIEIKAGAKSLTAPGSVNAEGKPYILIGDLDQVPELYPFIAAKLPREKHEPKKYIPMTMNKKEYGRSSWEQIKKWTDDDRRGGGGRNELAYSLAVHAATHDWPESETLDALRGEPSIDGLPETEIRTAVKSAYKRRRSA